MIYGFIKALHKTIKVFFVNEDLVSFITFSVEFFGALGDSDVKILTLGLPDIKKVRPSSSSSYFGCVQAFESSILAFHANVNFG